MTPSQGDGPLAVFEYPTRATITSSQKPVYTAHNSARLAKVRLEEQQTREWACAAEGNATGFAPGATVTVSGHVRTEYDQRYLVTGVEHVGHAWTATAEDVSLGPKIMQMLQLLNAEIIDRSEGEWSLPERYRNRSSLARMQGSAASVPFRPARVTPRPIVEGPQSARVVGPRGEELYVDEHARIKVQFHRDHVGEENEQSSCWGRTAQLWAGSGWGFVFVPRINKHQDTEVHGSTGLTVDVEHVYRLEANDKIVLKCGDSTLIMTPQGVWVNGGVVKFNGSDKPWP